MIDILSFLPARRKSSPGGWISFDAPCCELRGLTSKKSQRGGMKLNPDDGWSYHCFNCGYTASYAPGRMLGFKAKQLLGWLGVDDLTIERINLESLRHRSIHGLLEDSQRTVKKVVIEFEEKDLPPNLEPVEPGEIQDYLKRRSLSLDYPYMTNPTLSRPNVLIPFTYKGMMVGNAIRFTDDRLPKFINDTQPGYVFGTDLQKPDWQYVIVTEGVFDALSIDGLAVLHNDINSQQVELIKSLERQVIVVPDRDEAGMKLVDRAVELGWAVSMPEWPEGCKDVNDAVIQMGKLATLITILAAKETSRIKIEMRKKKLLK